MCGCRFEGIDRMYLNVYVPQLQSEQGVVRFFKYHRGQPLPSAALMSPLSRGFVAQLERFVARDGIALLQFRKGERKDAVMAEHLRGFAGEEGVLFVGKAQEKTPVFRTEKRRSPTTGLPYPWIVRSSAMVSRLRAGPGAANMAVVRHFARQAKRAIKRRRKMASWDPTYLAEILGAPAY